MKQIKVLQCRIESPKAFRRWDAINGEVNLNDYEQVWNGQVNSDDEDYLILEDLFRVLNRDRVEGFTGHSLSVSDIVILDGKKYFCDSFGWKLF